MLRVLCVLWHAVRARGSVIQVQRNLGFWEAGLKRYTFKKRIKDGCLLAKHRKSCTSSSFCQFDCYEACSLYNGNTLMYRISERLSAWKRTRYYNSKKGKAEMDELAELNEPN